MPIPLLVPLELEIAREFLLDDVEGASRKACVVAIGRLFVRDADKRLAVRGKPELRYGAMIGQHERGPTGSRFYCLMRLDHECFFSIDVARFFRRILC